MESYTLEEIKDFNIGIRASSEEEVENFTKLVHNIYNDKLFSEWASGEIRANVIIDLTNNKKVLHIDGCNKWQLGYERNRSKIIDLTQVEEYVNTYLKYQKYNFNKRLLNKAEILIHCPKFEQFEALWKLSYEKASTNLYYMWSEHKDHTVIRLSLDKIVDRIGFFGCTDWYCLQYKYKDKKIHNFEDVLIKEPTIKKTKQIKQQGKEMKNSPYLRVFSKGKLNVAGLFHQMAKLGTVEEPRQFVLDEIEKEIERVKEIIKDIKFDEVREKFKAKYNIVALSALDALKNLNDAPLFVLNDTDKVSMVLAYYKLEKVKNDETSYEWIKPYLTHKVLNNPNKTVLFKSKKREVYIKDGEIFLEDAHDEVVSRAEISYNSETNTFSL